MKKKQLFIILFLMLIISICGITKGLAAEIIFKLSKAEIVDKSPTVEAEIVNYDNDNIDINSTFHKIDDFISYKVVIKNTSSKDYKIKNISLNNPNPYLEYTCSSLENKVVKAKEEIEIVVTAKYINEVEDIKKRDSEEQFKLTLDYVDNNNDITTETISINPRTNDKIIAYVILGIVSLTGLALTIKNKTIKKLTIFVITFIPFVVYAFSSNVTFNFDTNVKLRDKIVVKEIINGKEIIKVIPYDTNLEKPEEPNIPGYKFIGWYIRNEKFDFSRQLKEDETIEAKLELIQYNINYNLNGGTASNKETYNVETETFELVNPVKEGYNFSGWTEENDDTLKTKVSIEKGTIGNKTFTANFSNDENTTYKVIHKYENLDNTYETEEEILTGTTESTVTPQVKSRVGFINPVEKSLTIKADGSSEITYTYSRTNLELIYQDEEYIDSENEAGTYKYGTTITVKAKNKEGYTFEKWSDNSSNINHTFIITEDTEIYPIYTINSYTVTFDGNNNLTPSTITRNYNTEIGTLPVPNKDNYIFDDWYTTNEFTEKVTPQTKIINNVTFYANWKKSVYFINTEDVEVTNQDTTQINIMNTEEIDEEYTYSSSDETIATVDANGVITGQSVGTTKIIITGTTSNITKEVNVTVNPRIFTITFQSNGDTASQELQVNEGTTINSFPEVSKTNYVFDKWYKEGYDEEFTTSTVITGSITVYGTWKKSVYFIETEDIEVNIPNTAQINITNIEEIGEEYTYSSNDETIATINESGLVTGVAEGTTTVVITGTTSNLTKEVNITVNPTILCRRATELHQETCSRNDDKGCVADGYLDTDLTFGTIPNKDNYRSGDAFDCDVNGNGEIDTDSNGNSTERFYYLRSVDEDHAALIYYSNVVNGLPNNNVTQAYDPAGKNYNIPTTLLLNLPSSTTWNNTSLINTNIQVLNENGETTANGNDLPIINYSNYSSRMPVVEDINIACNVIAIPTSDTTIPVTGKSSCRYLFESTTYMNDDNKSGYWLATASSIYTNRIFRIVGSTHRVHDKEANGSTGSGIRPVIEVPYTRMERPLVSTTYEVSFNSQGGSNVSMIEVAKNTAIGTLPENPTRTNYDFKGWYTDTNYTDKITEETIITSDITVYAKWIQTGSVAEYNNKGYTSVASAINKVSTTETGRITLLSDSNEKINIPSGKTIELDLNGFTISRTIDENVINNRGTLTVFNGNLVSEATTNAVINNNNGGIIYINNVDITHNGERSALYNYGGGIAYIDDGSDLYANNDQRATIINLANGEVHVLNATVRSYNKPGIDNAGILTIGNNDGTVNTESPIIIGKNNGITTTTNIEFYDGTIKGTSSPINDTTKIPKIEEHYQKLYTEDSEYKLLYLVPEG